MQRKTFDLVEAKADPEKGTFTALASVFGNVDKGGDRMLPGSFTKTLAKWRESGKSIPIILSHQWDDLTAYVGKADPRAIYEDEKGLVVQGSLFMDDTGAQKVHRLMKEGLLNGWSFGYTVPKGGQEKKDGVNEVSEVELFETGPTLVGMNPEAQLQDVKQMPAGPHVMPYADCPTDRPIALMNGEEMVSCHANEADARAAMGNMMASEDPEEKTSTQEQGPNEEPSSVKSRPDALKYDSLTASLETLGDGVKVAKPVPPPDPEEDPELEYTALKERSRAAMLDVIRST